MTKILVTGGSGFIAAHLVDQLLAAGHTVVTTVRSEDKAARLRDAHADKGERLSVAVVGDIAVEGAFDKVVEGTPGLEVVMHTASPFHFKWTDAQTELIDPALVGTTSILRAVHRSAPSVRRVVVTSSFAAVLTETLLDDPATTFSEASWNPSTLADVHSSPATAYRVSKTLAERAAWDFVAREKPAFDLATVCPPMVYGPLAPGVGVASLDAVNTSNERFVAMLRGKWASEIPATGPVSIWVDVRDVARAHVLAMEKPDAGGRRLYTVGGRFSNRRLVEIVRERFPEYKDRLPGPDVPGGEAPPADKNFKYNNDETVRVLGIKWTSLEDSVEGVVQSLKKYGL
ncbi:methylglyoxal reductase (NADPH-dependent) gre2 [Purpureocillium lilacinum]|uniref:NAD-dependent epimerase/dehydratase domain-containing protein n=1 Tax=Purpureocillium lilacinum TaxID=33203 RepID=A0A2U3EH67_PURLI|nr:hypothetical protein PCL_09056 [Purpureocillium lilacinum]GJN74193.1 methylglyoxal reductase (NADPH-dependent) gre2 [Purpureocillium lilacinum]GJN84711.1 methylglyoxal reductase (NADPH-dependent) gre2 [Purpureocillium lilacinum]